LICINPVPGHLVSFLVGLRTLELLTRESENEIPAGCTVSAGVVLRPRPVARAVVTPGVGAVGTPMNRGGPVDRVGRR
jgi:hypothetical protein